MVGRLTGWFQENHFKESSNLPRIVPLKCQRIASSVKHGSFAEGRMISECVGVSADDITVMISPLRTILSINIHYVSFLVKNLKIACLQ